MPDFEVHDVPGFPGRFAFVPTVPIVLNTDQQRFCDRIDALMVRYAEIGEPNAPVWPLRNQARNRSLQELRSTAEDVAAGRLPADRAILTTYRIQGRWDAALERIDAKPFLVQALDIDGQVVPPQDLGQAHDLRITVRDVPISQEKLRFKIDIDRTLTVIKVILPAATAGEDPYAAGRALAIPAATTPTAAAATPRRRCVTADLWRGLATWFANRAIVQCIAGPPLPPPANTLLTRRSNYIKQLAGIARVGLESTDPSLVTLATQSLGSLREEIVSMEAGAVKNRYLWRLGWRCLAAAILSTAGYLFVTRTCPIQYGPPKQVPACTAFPVASAFRNFFLLTAGTAVGTWLSFSLRRVILTFLDLATLEDDRLDPTVRVLFVTALASVVGLLFWTGAVTVGIGDFKSDFSNRGAYALLIGLLLGIAERTMATAVSKRATDFAGAIGGK